ncbi:MAG: beta-lactamase family protein [Acidimicrobiia bacterium]|nr:beta-lactamase family protein [Acidimicrobiia bacterium]
MTDPGNDRLRTLLVEFRERFKTPAAGAAVVTRSGALEVDVVGNRQRGSADPATIDDQWHIGSCTKAITAVLYARLVEQGITEWGIPIGNLFPDLGDAIDTGWAEPTVDEVLLCRSGMNANLSRAEMLAAWEDTSPMSEQRTRAAVSALSSSPRSRGSFRYSNLGYIVAGAAIDRLAGMPFEDALHSEVLDPLGITSVGFGAPPDIWGHRPKLRIRRHILGRGSPAEPGSLRSDNPAVMTPAGRIHLTLSDWAKFQAVFLNQGGDLLDPGTVEHLLAVPPGKGRGMVMGWAPAADIDGASFGMWGTNTMWAATALIDSNFERTAMVVANDGRSKILRRSAQLAANILQAG